MPRRVVMAVAVALGLAAVGACAGSVDDSTATGDHHGSGGKAGTGGSGGTGGGAGAQPWPDGGGGTGNGAVPDAGGASGSGGSGGSSGSSGSGGSGGSGGACTPEICNNLDDNCDGQIDENLSRTCQSSCGSGTQTCASGQWGPCSALQPIACMNYQTCAMDQECVASCPAAPTETCDLKDDDCNGSCDDGAGCRAGVYRSYKGSTGEHFYTPSASEAACCGFVVEFADYFYVYTSAAANLVALNRCVLAGNMHFLTTTSNCEGAVGSTNEGPIGYVAQAATCGAVPLYRLASTSTADHLYTTSASERQTALGSGYLDEGITGYVWNAP